MEFYNPGLLWFAAGGSIPVIIHLLNKQRYKTVRWGAMEFLLLAIKKTQRRLKLENLILLLLRIAIMVLLAMAIARPFLRESSFAGVGHTETHYIFVVDNSYSMGYKVGQKTSLDRAKEEAVRNFKETVKFTSQDRATIVLMSDMPELTFMYENQKQLIVNALNEIALSDTGTSMMRTMEIVKKALADSRIPNQRVYIYTDMQRASWIPEEQGEEFKSLLKQLSQDKRNQFFLIDVGAEKPENHGITDIRTLDQYATTKTATRIVADLYNYTSTDVQNQTVSLFVDGEKKESKTVSIPGGGKVPITFSYNFVPDVDVGPHHVHIELEPDYLVEDDRRYLALDVRDHLKVLCVDGDPGMGGDLFGSELGYFTLALGPYGERATFQIDKRITTTFTGDDLEEYGFVVLANVDNLFEDKVSRLESYVRDGGSLFITLGHKTFENRRWFNDSMYRSGQGMSPGGLVEVIGDDKHQRGFSLTEIRWNRHPFQYFDANNLRAQMAPPYPPFYEFARLQIPENDKTVSVLARFNDADYSPAFVEKTFGKGRVFLFTSTLDFDWQEMPPAPYAVLMHELAKYLSSRPMGELNLQVGDMFSISLPMKSNHPVRRYAEKFSLREPDGGFATLPSFKSTQEDKFVIPYPARREEEKDPKEPKASTPRKTGLRNAGVYSIHHIDAKKEDKPLVYFVANVPPSEGNLERISEEEIRRFYPDFRFEMAGLNKGKVDDQLGKAAGKGFWKHLFYALLGFLILETFLAYWFGRFK